MSEIKVQKPPVTEDHTRTITLIDRPLLPPDPDETLIQPGSKDVNTPGPCPTDNGRIYYRGNIEIHSSAVVNADVYSGGDISIHDERTVVTGRMVALGNIEIHADAVFNGPVYAKGESTIHSRAKVTGTIVLGDAGVTIFDSGTEVRAQVIGKVITTQAFPTIYGQIVPLLSADINNSVLHPSDPGSTITVVSWEEK
jgi:hypothetical protein